MLTHLTQGSTGLLLAYVLSALGLWLGFRCLPVRKLLRLHIVWLAVPTMLIAAVAWALLVALGLRALGPAPRAFLGALFQVLIGFLAARFVARRRPALVLHQRGTLLAPASLPQHRGPAPDASVLTFAGQPVPPSDETKHFKLLGTTGTGKSTAIRELLTGALARGDRALIADPDGGYLDSFYSRDRGDQLLNPWNPRAARWDLFAELIEPHDADQLARAFVPDHEGSERSWRHYARTFISAVLRQLQRTSEPSLVQLYQLVFLAPVEDLRDLLADSPAAPFLGADNGKFFESVRSVAATHLAALEPLARQVDGEPLSVRRWVREGSGVLFLPYRAGEIATLRQLISAWMRLAIFEAMNGQSVGEGGSRLWFILDELDALGAIDGLKDALARLRKFGGRCVLGLQSIAQARGTYGDAEAQTVIENCGNTLILRCSASEHGGTAEFASRLIGRREIVRRVQTRTRPLRIGGLLHQSESVSEQHVIEDAVMPSEIEQLPDLTGYLKFASQPAWRRVKVPL
jgi:type IV secretory pathway TraG/TraD family ATPase VirD4